MNTTLLLFFFLIQGTEPKPVAIQNATIVVSPDQTIEKGTIVLRGSLIAAVGEKVDIPYDAEIIDGSGLFVYPGFLDAHTRVGMPDTLRKDGEKKAAESKVPDFTKGPVPHMRHANRKGIFPDFEASRVVTIPAGILKKFHQGGFTTVLAAPKAQIFSGTSALINLNGETRRTAMVQPGVAMHAGLQADGPGYPRTLMGAMALFRQTLLDAKQYREQHKAYQPGTRRPPHDPALEALQPVLDGTIPIAFEVRRLNNIRRAIALGKEFNLTVWIAGGDQTYRAVSELKENKIPVLLSLAWPENPEKERKKKREESEPEKLIQEKQRLWEEKVRCAITLEKEGIPFAFSTLGLDSPNKLFTKMHELTERGLTHAAALRALTMIPADLMGAGKVTGRLAAGRMGNLTVLDAQLGKKKVRVRYIFSDGHKFKYEKKKSSGLKPAIDVTGTWTVTSESESGTIEATLDVEQDGADVTGKLTSEMGTLEIENGLVEGKKFSFFIAISTGDRKHIIQYTGEMEEGELLGTSEGPRGKGSWKAVKPEQ